jgi:hypothetical protein
MMNNAYGNIGSSGIVGAAALTGLIVHCIHLDRKRGGYLDGDLDRCLLLKRISTLVDCHTQIGPYLQYDLGGMD